MFKLKRIKEVCWCQHLEIEHTFAPGTTGIVGPNGRGKSNFVLGIVTAITGKPPLGTIEENMNAGGEATILELEFSMNGTDGVIHREFKGELVDNVRVSVKSTAWLTFGNDPKVTGTRKVTDKMEQITGLTPKVIRDHIFISQDALVSLLFSTKAERLAGFMTLVPEVEQAEPLRPRLAAEMERYPEIELGLKSDVLRQQRETLETTLSTTTTDSSTVSLTRQALPIDECRELVTKASKRVDLERSITATTGAIKIAADSVTDLITQQAIEDTTYADTLRITEKLEPENTAARTELATLESNQKVAVARATTQDQLNKLLANIEVRKEPDDGGRPWDNMPALVAEYTKWSDISRDAEKTITLLQDGKRECPTCGNEFKDPDATLAKAQKIAAEARGPLQEADRTRNEASAAEQVYTRVEAEYRTWAETAMQQVTTLNAQLTTMPNVQAPSPDRLVELNAICSEFASAETMLKAAEVQVNEIRTKFAAAEASKQQLETQITTTTAELDELPTAVAVQQAQTVVDEYTALTVKLSELNGRSTAQTEELERIKTQEAEAANLESKVDAVRGYRDLLARARDVLHRDKLPNDVLATKLDHLNVLTNRFLGYFGNPFAVTIERDMGILFTMPDGYQSTSAERLSGGQKCILSVAFRFAINELFAKSMGLMVLDEPTAWMDLDALSGIGEVIKKAQQISTASGVQTIMITHAEVLKAEFEHVIDMT